MYIWLPITIKTNGDIEIPWRDSWDLSIFGQKTEVLGRGQLVPLAPHDVINPKDATPRFFDISGRSQLVSRNISTLPLVKLNSSGKNSIVLKQVKK
jgi:hypothetical protein